MANLRHRYGTAFQSHWDAGTALSVEEAVADALSGSWDANDSSTDPLEAPSANGASNSR
jgi:hypothetical protein